MMNKRLAALGATLGALLAVSAAGCTVVINSENVSVRQDSQIAGSEFFEAAEKLGEAALESTTE